MSEQPESSPSAAHASAAAENLKRATACLQRGDLAQAERVLEELLAQAPDQIEALHLLGIVKFQTGQHEAGLALIGQAISRKPDFVEAENNRANMLRALNRLEAALASYDRAIALKPDYAAAFCNRGFVLFALGRREEALASCDTALAQRPDFAEAHGNRGLILQGLGRLEEAVASFDQAVALRPNVAAFHSHRGIALQGLGRLEEALASCDAAIALQADAEALFNRGNVLRELERRQEALASFDAAIARKPEFVEAWSNRGLVLRKLERLDEALASFDRAIALRPDFLAALSNRGIVLQELKRFEEALACHDRAIALKPDYAEAHSDRGNVLRELRRFEEALASCDRAIALKPGHAEAYLHRGNALLDLSRFEEALALYDRAIALKPQFAAAYRKRAGVLHRLKRLEEAAANYETALATDPDDRYVFGGLADCVNRLSDWDKRRAVAEKLEAEIAAKRSVIPPFAALAYLDEPRLLRQCAENFVNSEIADDQPPLWRGESWRNEKIKIAYLSADYRLHPVAILIAELIERHDRARFEILGVSFGGDDRSELRARVVRAFERFIDVRSMSPAEVANLLADLKVDIAVDLMGYTEDSRPKILARRPAPIQVNFLGFPATMGTDCVDYIIVDAIVAPFDQQPFYSERLVHLPDCYQPNDRLLKISSDSPSRADAGLPEDRFIFCCFNNSWKISPEVFDAWMRILKAVDGSVLWLYCNNARTEINLRTEARSRNVDPARLIFAPRVKLDDHLARQRLGDLFLDTSPYNAGATASAALWVGLPLLTYTGKTFVGRMATSLLHAIGLPELATSSLADYEALAIALARDPKRLGEIKAKLAQNRDALPLFDTDRFRCGLEAAYVRMWELWQDGRPPESFAIPRTMAWSRSA